MSRHVKSVRREILQYLYKRYQRDPLTMSSPSDFFESTSVTKQELVQNIHYLHDSGLVELMMGYHPTLFAAARIKAAGIDLVENHLEFNLRFPPEPEANEQELADLARLVESLYQEAEISPLDAEQRRCLLRDAQYLREELARPAGRWRPDVVKTVLEWIADYFDDLGEHLPSLSALEQAIDRAFEADYQV